MMAVFLPPQHWCFAIGKYLHGLLHIELIDITVVHVPVVERLGLGHIEAVGAGILCGHKVHIQAGLVHILEGK